MIGNINIILFPGEFTKRAFYAGKLDLTAVEGLNDLINSETEFQRKQALNQLEGSLFHVYTEWKNILTKVYDHLIKLKMF